MAEHDDESTEAVEPVIDKEAANTTAAKRDESDHFDKVFVVAIPKGVTMDLDNLLSEQFHQANYAATLQESLNRGLHPTGPVQFVNADGDGNGSLACTYTVPVVPASDPDHLAAHTVTPSSAIKDMGGDTNTDQ